jgi:integrase
VTGKIGGVLEKNETVPRAIELYLADAVARKLSLRSVYRYRRFLEASFLPWCMEHHVRHVRDIDFEKAAKYRAGWTTWSAYTAARNLELLRMFFRFCQKAKWIDENPAEQLRSPEVTASPTLPFTEEEERQIIAACDLYRTHNKHGKRSPERLRAFVLALRYTGLRIGDVATLEVSKLEGNAVLLYTHKTGVPVYCPIPPFVVEALREQARLNSNQEYFFWTGRSTVKCATVLWQRSLLTLFRKAKIEKPKTGRNGAHRFRDTFAVSLLLAGVPVEDVAILLGHATPATTSKHYSPWVQARREKLEERVSRTWKLTPKYAVIAGGG